jgi:hypothetical protein
MPYRHVLQSGPWVLAASVLFAACAGVPGRGVPDRYEQSFDSATISCRQNPALCARMAGEEAVVPQAAQNLAAAGGSAAAVGMALDAELKTRIEQALKDCAEHARTQVLIDQRQGRTPTPGECNEVVPGRNVTLAMFLGQEMHRVALQCTEERLGQLRPGGFSLEPRYRYEGVMRKTTFISEQEAQALLRQRRGDELKGTLRPDVVIHSGDPLRVDIVYDFKFSCTGTSPAAWSEYPEGHPYEGILQKQMYETVLKTMAWRIVPWWGVLP